MKTFALSLVVVVLALTLSSAAHADVYTISLKTGAVTDTLIDTPILNGDIFTYTHETLGILGNDDLLSSSTSIFTATYTDVLGTLGVLNVTDVCVHVTLLGDNDVPCQAFAFSFTDVTLPIASIVASVGVAVDVNANIADLDVAGGSIGAASGTFNFGPPPPPSATPEPSSLCLMATGLLSAAGAVRRRFAAPTTA